MKIITNICRILLGLIFIFSGLIKANDPLGFSYKLDEYFEVFNMLWASKLSLTLSIFACSFEVALGFAMLIGGRIKLVNWLFLLMLIFFAFLTGYAAITGKIHECGCFGDAIKFAPKQEVWNDLFMLLMCIVIMFNTRYIKPLFKGKGSDMALILAAVIGFGFTLYTYYYLPIVDFLPYKVGVNIAQARQLPPNAKPTIIKSLFIYKDKATGAKHSYDDKALAALSQDSVAYSKLEYVDRKDSTIQEGDKPAISDFYVNYNSKDVTDSLLKIKGYMLWFVSQDVSTVSHMTWDKIAGLLPTCDKNHVTVMTLAASSYDVTEPIRHEKNLAMPFYVIDYVVSKSMLRSNGGAILLKDGTVVKKWSAAGLPSADALAQLVQ